MRASARPLILTLATLCGAATAQISVPPDFQVSVFQVPSQFTGLAMADGGPFGGHLYASRGGAVNRVNPWTGQVTGFATGFQGGTNRPAGIAFDPGTFGTGHLYVAEHLGRVRRVSPFGGVYTFANGGSLTACNDLAFAPQGSPFGALLLVSNGDIVTGNIAWVSPSGAQGVFAPSSSFSAAPLGVAFPPPGSLFAADLYAALPLSGQIVRVSPAGQVTPFVSAAGGPVDIAFPPDPTGPFGDHAYVTDVAAGSVLRVAPDGSSAIWAAGIPYTFTGWDAEIGFSADGLTMFVSRDADLLVIRAPCTPGNGQANDPQARLEVNGLGAAMCPGPFQARIHAGGLLTLDWSGPPNAPLMLFYGPPAPQSTPVGCVGLLDIGTPPAFSDLIVVLDGLYPAPPGNPFHLNASGSLQMSFSMPNFPAVSLGAIQGAVVVAPQPAPCSILLTAAFELIVY